MLTWFVVNVVLSLLALGFITLNGTAPHRLRFVAGFAALAAWLVPWPLLPNLLPANMFSLELGRIERVVESTSVRLTDVIQVISTVDASPVTPRFSTFTLVELGFAALVLIGCLLFAWKVVSHRALLRRLERSGGDGNWLWERASLVPACPVGVQRDIPGAFSSGLINPRIWVHAGLVDSPQLQTVLQHEMTHIRQHDNWYLLVITFVECLFWWNPLVKYIGHSTRELQELSCDELCQRSSPDYPVQLAQLMIDSARGGLQPRMLAFGANIFNNPNPNLKRIQLLQRSYPMLKKHKFSVAVTAASALLSVGLVTAQPDALPAAAGDVLSMNAEVRYGIFAERTSPSAGDPGLFRRVDMVNGEEQISFSISNIPLPQALIFASEVSRMTVGVAVVRPLDGSAATAELSTAQLIEEMEAAGGAANWQLENRVTSFHPRFVSDKIVLKYAGAADKLVTVAVTSLPIREAIDAIAEASGCNIFQDGDTIVVDYCND